MFLMRSTFEIQDDYLFDDDYQFRKRGVNDNGNIRVNKGKMIILKKNIIDNDNHYQ
jgi:hypothetical protein